MLRTGLFGDGPRRTRTQPLDQINKSNIDDLAEAWRVELDSPNVATPLVHNGVMFLASAQDSVLALDATTESSCGNTNIAQLDFQV